MQRQGIDRNRVEAECFERRTQSILRHLPAGKYGKRMGRRVGGDGLRHQARHPPCDRRRRINPTNGPRRKLFEAITHKRIMRAGKCDDIGAPPTLLDEAWRNLREQIGIADGIHATPLRQARQAVARRQG